MTTNSLPNIRFGANNRFIMRDVRSLPSINLSKAKILLQKMWNKLPPLIHCQGSLEKELDLVDALGGQSAIDDFLLNSDNRLTEDDYKGDIRPINQIIFDTQNNDSIVAAWQWYNIVRFGSNPVKIGCRPWPVFPLSLNPSVVGRLSVDILEIFLSHPGLNFNGTIFQVGQIRTFTFPNNPHPSPYDPHLDAYQAEIDARGADPNNPLTVNVVATAWGGEDRHLTWNP